jgi:hypothetical protein
LLEKQGTFGRLARLHAGESLDALVSEYKGVEPAAAEKAAVAAEEPAPALVERVTDAVGGVVEAVATPVAAVVERVEDAIQAVLETDEEE